MQQATGEMMMMNPNSLDAYVTFRINRSMQKDFMDKANRYGKPSDVLREFVEAFLDDRLVIQPNPRKESLYVTRS